MSIAYGNNKFYAVGANNKSAISTDAQTWTESYLPLSTGNPMPLAYSNNILLLSHYFRSYPAGSTYVNVTSDHYVNSVKQNRNSVNYIKPYSGGFLAMVVEDGKWKIGKSANGTVWTTFSTFPSTVTPGEFLIEGNGSIICFGQNHPNDVYFLESDNTWSRHSMPTFSSIYNAVYKDFVSSVIFTDKFITRPNGAAIWYSVDGKTWNKSSTTVNLSAMIYDKSNSIYVGVEDSSTGNVYISNDGIDWNIDPTLKLPADRYTSFVHGNGKIVAIGLNTGKLSIIQ